MPAYSWENKPLVQSAFLIFNGTESLGRKNGAISRVTIKQKDKGGDGEGSVVTYAPPYANCKCWCSSPTPNKSLASESQYQLLLIIGSSFIDVYTPGCLLIKSTVYIFFFFRF